MGTENKKLPSYILIANRIEEQIRKGEKLPGEKLASIRQLAATEGVTKKHREGLIKFADIIRTNLI